MRTIRRSHKAMQAAVLLALFAAFSPAVGQAQYRVIENGPPHVKLPGMPTRSQIIRDIYFEKGAGTPSGGPVAFDLGDGREAVWWYGHGFDFNDRDYITAFVYLSRGDDPDGGDDLASVAQATYRMGSAGWRLIDTDGHIGSFALGRISERAADVDTDGRVQTDGRKVVRHETADGRLLLAVPTRTFAYGIERLGYEMFLFDPNRVDPVRNGLWAALGWVDAGANNAADCDEESRRACWAMTGSLSFVPRPAGVPDVKISFSGSRLEGPGHIRKLGPDDHMSYSYDADERAYVVATSTIAAS